MAVLTYTARIAWAKHILTRPLFLAIGSGESSWDTKPKEVDYRETNNIYSLYKALDFFDDDSLMLECDIFYRVDLLRKLLTGGGDCTILVSPFDVETMDGSVIRANGDRALELVLGKWQGEGFDYADAFKTVNMYKFTRDFMTRLYAPLIRWYVENVGENIYYEKVLGSLIYYREMDIRTVNVPADMWCEIDDESDLLRARRRFAKDD